MCRSRRKAACTGELFQEVRKGSLPKGLGSREEEMAGKKAGDFETHETLEVPA